MRLRSILQRWPCFNTAPFHVLSFIRNVQVSAWDLCIKMAAKGLLAKPTHVSTLPLQVLPHADQSVVSELRHPLCASVGHDRQPDARVFVACLSSLHDVPVLAAAIHPLVPQFLRRYCHHFRRVSLAVKACLQHRHVVSSAIHVGETLCAQVLQAGVASPVTKFAANAYSFAASKASGPQRHPLPPRGERY
jgi:hypothetical protein